MGARRADRIDGLVYDTGALIAADRSDRRMWAIHQRALTRGVRPLIPAGCLVGVWQRGRRVNMKRLFAGCAVEPLSNDAAKRAGELRAQVQGGASAIDATVAELAVRACGGRDGRPRRHHGPPGQGAAPVLHRRRLTRRREAQPASVCRDDAGVTGSQLAVRR
jgi:hypothetical protein